MLQNAYLLAKIGADTAEQHVAETLPIGRRHEGHWRWPRGKVALLMQIGHDVGPPTGFSTLRDVSSTAEWQIISGLVWFFLRFLT